MSTEHSYRTILRATSIIGGASVINVLSSIAKMKAAAVLLGPAGVGIIGIYINLVQAAGALFALGLNASGTRQIASANTEGGGTQVAHTRRALILITLFTAPMGALLFWGSSGWVATAILNDPNLASELSWLSIGVGFTIIAGTQTAILTGLRRIPDLAVINTVSGVLGAVLGIVALWMFGTGGILPMVIASPAIMLLMGWVFVRKTKHGRQRLHSFSDLSAETTTLIRLGIALMMSGAVTLLGHLAVRSIVTRELGPEALGHFQAAWAIGMTYIAFVLTSMGTDYYPRLTAAIKDHEAAARLINEQTEVALLLCAPVLVALLGLAPWVIQLLYTSEFYPAVEVLRWQLLGDILKVISWPLGFVLLALGAGKTFFFAEASAVAVFVFGVHFGLPLLGLSATGIFFLVLYFVYLPLVYWLARRMIGFRWSREVALQALLICASALLVEIAARWSDIAGAATGLLLSILLAVWALVRLADMTNATGRLAKLARIGKRLKVWLPMRP